MQVRPIDSAAHLAFVASRPSASFLQVPSWGAVKAEWRSESLGWFDAGDRLVGAGLVLHRRLPRLKRSLAYLPEGPLLDWAAVAAEPGRWLDPLVAHLRSAGAFGIKMGPPVGVRRWSAETIKAAVAGGTARSLGEVPPDSEDADGVRLGAALAAAGWRAPRSSADEGGFAAGQPRFVFQVPLEGRTEADLLAGFNQLWRRNIKKAEKAGVVVQRGGADDLAAFHELYVETAHRDGFTPRPLHYFTRMWRAMTDEDPTRITVYLARCNDQLLAATTMVRVGEHAWYSYGASSTAGREYRGSNAVQWAMARDALAAGCTVYDMRGITDTIAEDDPHYGLIQFKLGTGGVAVELLGEWDLPINKALYVAFDAYMRRRS